MWKMGQASESQMMSQEDRSSGAPNTVRCPLGLVRVVHAEGRGCKASPVQDVGSHCSCSPPSGSSLLSPAEGSIASAFRWAMGIVLADGLWMGVMRSCLPS